MVHAISNISSDKTGCASSIRSSQYIASIVVWLPSIVIITVSHGSAYTVLRATQQVNGNGNFGVSEFCNP